jgi:hypothetical protein
MKKIIVSFLVLAFSITFPLNVSAKQIYFQDDFSSVNPNLVFNYSGRVDPMNEVAILTETTNAGEKGSFFYTQPVKTNRLHAEFDFKIDSLDPIGADGFTFAVIDSLNPYSIGGSGGDMGYKGLSGLAIEFDIHWNPENYDSSGNHIALDINGSVESLVINNSIPILQDNGLFHAEIDIMGGKNIVVYLSNDSIGYPKTKIIDYQIQNFDQFIGLAGFTGSHGSASAKQIIDNFYLSKN